MKLLILTLILAEFLYSRTLTLLSVRASRQKVPAELEGIYDKQAYIKQQAYLRSNARMGIFDATVGLILSLWLFAGDGYVLFDRCCHGNSLLFFGAIFTFSTILEIPLSAYNQFCIEQRFGFNQSTVRLFLRDQLTNYLMAILLGGSLIWLIMLIYQHTPHLCFAFAAWAVVMLFSLFMSFFYSDLIVPLFNKQTPLSAGELRTAIFQFAARAGVPIQEVYIMDASKRSTKANAYFTGWGRRKRIVLFDTLLEQLSTDEIVAVLAHEMGHQRHHHILKQMLLAGALNLLVFILLAYVLNSDAIAQAAGLPRASFHVNLLVFTLLYEPLNIVVELLTNLLSRRCEYEADHFVREMGMQNALISALKKISAQALSNLTPHPVTVFMEYSHPTLLQRIRALQA